MGARIYITEHNITGEIVSEMAYGAYVKFLLGGIEHNVLIDKEDYIILDDMFFGGDET